jgi:hypothetical protein
MIMDENKEHPMYKTYIYWKENQRKIKDRIQETFKLDYIIP